MNTKRYCSNGEFASGGSSNVEMLALFGLMNRNNSMMNRSSASKGSEFGVPAAAGVAVDTGCIAAVNAARTSGGVSPVSAPGSSPDGVVDHGTAHVRLSVLLGNELAASANEGERAEARRAHAAIGTHADAHQYIAAVKTGADRRRAARTDGT